MNHTSQVHSNLPSSSAQNVGLTGKDMTLEIRPGRQYKHVRALERGLAVLVAVSRNDNASVAEISAYAGVPRTSAYRLLETLEELDYVRRSNEGQSYTVTSHLRILTSNNQDRIQLAERSSSVLRNLVREVLWPSSLAIVDHNAMRIVETTHPLSPYSIHHNAIGTRLPLMTTALGKCYLSFCEETERTAILENVSQLYDKHTMKRLKNKLLETLPVAQKNGYAVSDGGTDPRFTSFAIPVRRAGRVVAALNLIFFRKSIAIEEAIERYLDALTLAVAQIETAVAEGPAISANFAPARSNEKHPSKSGDRGCLPAVRDQSAAALPSER